MPAAGLSLERLAGASKPCRPLPCSVEHGKNVDVAVPYTVGDNVGSPGHNQLAGPVATSDSCKRGMVMGPPFCSHCITTHPAYWLATGISRVRWHGLCSLIYRVSEHGR